MTTNELAIILMVAHKATQPIDGFTDLELYTDNWMLTIVGGKCTLRTPYCDEKVDSTYCSKVDYNTLQEWVREESAGVCD